MNKKDIFFRPEAETPFLPALSFKAWKRKRKMFSVPNAPPLRQAFHRRSAPEAVHVFPFGKDCGQNKDGNAEHFHP